MSARVVAKAMLVSIVVALLAAIADATEQIVRAEPWEDHGVWVVFAGVVAGLVGFLAFWEDR